MGPGAEGGGAIRGLIRAIAKKATRSGRLFYLRQSPGLTLAYAMRVAYATPCFLNQASIFAHASSATSLR